MLKRGIALALTVLTLFGLCSCGLFGREEEPETTTEFILTWPTEEETTEEPTTEETTEESTVEVIEETSRRVTTGNNTGTKSTTKAPGKPGCDHDYADATCDKPQTCKKCGYEYGKPSKHNYAAATCEKPETCRNCGATKGSALGHSGIPCSRKGCPLNPNTGAPVVSSTHPPKTTAPEATSETAAPTTAATTEATTQATTAESTTQATTAAPTVMSDDKF